MVTFPKTANMMKQKNEQAKVEAEIAELEDNIKHAVVLDETKVKSNMVNVGSVVKLRNFQITWSLLIPLLGSTEADPMAGRISDLSPIGRAIIGTKKGDKVKVEIPAGEMELEILDVKRDK